MAQILKVKASSSHLVDVTLDSLPDKCPKCHAHVQPIHIVSIQIKTGNRFQSVFQCPRAACNELFLTKYQVNGDIAPNRSIKVTSFMRVEPIYARSSSFPDAIRALSPGFVEIYDQALAAQAENLDQVYGMALRKALEFLIKDFACKNNPNEEKKIRKKLLMQCIRENIDDANITKAAERATWLGNDETHYTRKWEDKDVGDLKKLVDLTVHAVGSALILAQLEEDMPRP